MRVREADRVDVELGLGLIGIGRPWGGAGAVPDLEQSERLLADAVELGIRLFDTAPAYGSSEQRLGIFLSGATDRRSSLTIVTKCGEYWDPERQAPYVDHSYDALCRGIDKSLERLGGIDLLLVHKASVDALRRPSTWRALEYALHNGVASAGASVSDLAAAKVAASLECLDWLQFPLNRLRSELAPAFLIAEHAGMRVLVNRPLASGEIVKGAAPREAVTDALQFVLSHRFGGGILVGTTSPKHLVENVRAFEAVRYSHAKE